MIVRDVIVSLVAGFLLRSLIDIVMEWRASRPRRFNLQRDYFDPCGPGCDNRRTSEIGWRTRGQRAVETVARRLRRGKVVGGDASPAV